MATVEFSHVDKVYAGGAHAVSDLNLQIKDGELLVFVGPSGCGKSTVLRLLAGLEDLTAGQIRIGRQVVDGMPPQRRNVAMVFQDYALYPHMSVRGNLEFPLKMRKLARAEIERRVAWAADLLGMSAWLDRLPKQLSGGQRQRVAMGRALVREPTVFLLDEPLSNLDAKLRVQVRSEIGDLQRRTGTTMIYVTHDQVEAMTLGDRVAVLHQGRLQQVAEPRELYERPANTFIAGFIGNPPMNLFPTRLSLGPGGGVRLAVGDQVLPMACGRVSDEGMRACLDRSLTAGVRPEAFRLVPEQASGSTLRAVVEDVEYLGHETLVYAHFDESEPGNSTVVARLGGMHVCSKGDPMRLAVNGRDVYLFDEAAKLISDT